MAKKSTVKKATTKAVAKTATKTGKKASSKDLMAPRVQASQDKLYGEIAIEENQLERFANRTLVRRYTIEFTCPEFTCVCPRSGFPDFATVKITYVPDKWCVELKSLKLYINGFRNKKVFHEDVTNVIIQDMIDLLDPWDIQVIGDFTVRGNIHTVITAEHSKD
ncbi:MAG: preQ(1) synthase [Bdellovibrionota bacterium]